MKQTIETFSGKSKPFLKIYRRMRDSTKLKALTIDNTKTLIGTVFLIRKRKV